MKRLDGRGRINDDRTICAKIYNKGIALTNIALCNLPITCRPALQPP